MDSSASDADPRFEKDQVSVSVSTVNAPDFLKKHGVFYQANSEIGRLAAQVDRDGVARDPSNLKRFLPILQSDPRVREILEPFDTQCRPLTWVLGSDYPNHYFARTISESEDEDHKIALYVCTPESKLEIFVHSQYLPTSGVWGANGLYEVPYRFLTEVKKLKETPVQMREGGVMIVHPRFSLGSTNGRAIGYGVPEKGYIFKSTIQQQEQQGRSS